ncbi:MAG: hypothetical protein D6820_02435 [Lentisphaerae bacterium]|nr:MAG: hypothetical protein D6820_02435 [Lentisphaerota bacterium]
MQTTIPDTPPPALLPPPCGHWLNLICVDYLGDRNGSILQCPLIEAEDGFNPYGGDKHYDCRIHTTILMNIIREGHDGGWSASGIDFGTDPDTILGWTRGTAFDTIPFRHAENPATAIFLAEGRKTIKNTMNGIGIFRFSESDHGIPELRDSRQTNAGERKVSWRHSGRFCVLFADGHTAFISRSAPKHWIAWYHNTSPSP